MGKVLVLLKRDMKNSLNIRWLFLLVFMLLLQLWFVAGSDSINQVKDSGQMGFMAVVFSFNLFGSIIALALNYDSISIEREGKVMDLILTSGISKKKVVWGKIINSLLVSGVFSGLYTAAMLLIYLLISKDPAFSLLTLRYFLPITVFLFIYGLLGLMLSILLRSSMASLVMAVILGGLMIPRLFLLFAEGFGNLTGLGEGAAEWIGMISPALIMNALSGYADADKIILAVILTAVYILVLAAFCMGAFISQDELNYVE